MRYLKFRPWFLTLTAALVIAFGALGLGAIAAAPTGITVSPAYQQVNIPQGQANVPIKFIITNHESQTQTIGLSARDFNTLGETGGLVFVGSNPTQLQKKYGLAKWLNLSQNHVVLKPDQTSIVQASILNLPTLNPGGHYGALLLSLNEGQANGSVNLHPVASSLLFVTKIGGDTHKLSLSGVQAKHNIFSLPASVTLRFHNDGNSHVVPRGLVTIADSGGRVISKGVVNQDSNIILPETYRLIDVQMQRVGHTPMIGKYTLRVDFRFDGISQYRRYQTSFWLVQWYLFAAAAILIVLALAIKGSVNLRSWR